eukprot:7544150-Alexandrium_andersonii.AAC.1
MLQVARAACSPGPGHQHESKVLAAATLACLPVAGGVRANVARAYSLAHVRNSQHGAWSETWA